MLFLFSEKKIINKGLIIKKQGGCIFHAPSCTANYEKVTLS